MEAAQRMITFPRSDLSAVLSCRPAAACSPPAPCHAPGPARARRRTRSSSSAQDQVRWSDDQARRFSVVESALERQVLKIGEARTQCVITVLPLLPRPVVASWSCQSIMEKGCISRTVLPILRAYQLLKPAPLRGRRALWRRS